MCGVLGKRLLCLFCAGCIVLTLGSGVASAAEKRVLFLSSYTLAWGSVGFQIRGLRESLKGSGCLVNYEFMDTKNTQYSAGYREFYELLRYKLATREPYDGIIAGDDAAFNFVMRYRNDLFPAIPVVFEGIDNVENAISMANDRNITGVVERVDYAKNLELVRTLFPEAKNLVLILDNMENGMGIARQLKNASALFADYNVSYINSSQYSRDELVDIFSSLTKDDIVFCISMGQYKGGGIYTEEERYKLIRHINVPLFRFTQSGVGRGLLGGYIVDHEACGRLAGVMLKSMLNGECPPLQMKTPSKYYFDDAVLRKYNITLPPLQNLELLNEPESFFQAYASVIIPALLAALSLAIFVLLLMLHNMSRRLHRQVEESHRRSAFSRACIALLTLQICPKVRRLLRLCRQAEGQETAAVEGKRLLYALDSAAGLAHLSTGDNTLHPEVYAYSDFLGYIKTIFEPLCKEKNLKFIWSNASPSVPVFIDTCQFNLVFRMVLTRAVRCAPEGGTIIYRVSVSAVEEGNLYCHFVLENSGAAVAAERSSIQMVSGSETNEQCELDVSRALVAGMRGTMDVHCLPDGGTAVTIDLPLPLATEEQLNRYEALRMAENTDAL